MRTIQRGRQRIGGSGVLLAVGTAAALLLGGCSDDHGGDAGPVDEAAEDGNGPGSEDVPEACELVDAADVEATFGGSASDGESQISGACDFDVRGSDLVGDGGVSVSVDSSPELDFDTLSEVYADGEAVDALGDEAIYTSNGLYVRVGDLIVRVAGTFHGFDTLEEEVERNEKAAAIELAGRVVDTL